MIYTGIHHTVTAHRVARHPSTFAWLFNNHYNLKDTFSNALTTVMNKNLILYLSSRWSFLGNQEKLYSQGHVENLEKLIYC